MEIPLYINGNLFETHTIDNWQSVWDQICKMTYEGTNICESIVTRPGIMYVDGQIIDDKTELSHSKIYAKSDHMNSYFLTLDNIWKQYSRVYGNKMPNVVPELKQLVVPFALYYDLGVKPWFRYCFPNCAITFWEG